MSRRTEEKRRLLLVKLNRALMGTGPFSRLDKMATAHHEAAHAIFKEAFGQRTLFITCDKFTKDGVEYLGFNKSEPMEMPAVMHLVIVLAGDEAERRMGVKVPEGKVSSSDAGEITELVETGFITEQDLYKAIDTTRDLVDKNWSYIHAVAARCYMKGRIEGSEVHAILSSMNFYSDSNPLKAYGADTMKRGLQQREALRVRKLAQEGTLTVQAVKDSILSVSKAIGAVPENDEALDRLAEFACAKIVESVQGAHPEN